MINADKPETRSAHASGSQSGITELSIQRAILLKQDGRSLLIIHDARKDLSLYSRVGPI